jgi:hypothetical protein
MIRHVVFFSARNPEHMDRILDGLSVLAQIPTAGRLEIGRNIKDDQLGNDVDVVVYGEFEDAAALAAYKAHPLYAEAVSIVRPLRELRIAADIDTRRLHVAGPPGG